MNLKNAVALITGGSSGIGRAVAQSLAASGARVAITGRDQVRLAETARELGVHPIHADVSVEADVERTYREVLQQFGDLDILVNNAGSGVFKNLVDFDRKEFEAVFATNVTGAMLMAREAAKTFRQAAAREHREYRVDGRAARRAERHRLLRQQVRSSRHDGVLASRTSPAQRPRISGQSQRSPDEFLSNGGSAAEGQCDQAARGGHRLRGESRCWRWTIAVSRRRYPSLRQIRRIDVSSGRRLPLAGSLDAVAKLETRCLRTKLHRRYLMLFSLPSFT